MNYENMKKIINLIDSPVEKLEMVMEFGKNIATVPENAICTQILGCASFVEICRDGNNFFGRADSDLVRGILAIVLALCLSLTVLVACNLESNSTQTNNDNQSQQTEKNDKYEKEMTIGQKNALGKAETYLKYSAFSRTGLINQLEFEGFEENDKK